MNTKTAIATATRMRSTSLGFVLAIVTLIVLFVCPLASIYADPPCPGGWVDPTLEPPEECPPEEPTYYTWLDYQPDWCLYGDGDEVLIHFNQSLVAYEWYVTPESDPGRDGDYMVVHGAMQSCYLYQYPF